MKKRNFERFTYQSLDNLDRFFYGNIKNAPDEKTRKQWIEEDQLIEVHPALVKTMIPESAWREGNYFPLALKKYKSNNCLIYIDGFWFITSKSPISAIDYADPGLKVWRHLNSLDPKYLSEHALKLKAYWDRIYFRRNCKRENYLFK